jgi:hypothetical protein
MTIIHGVNNEESPRPPFGRHRELGVDTGFGDAELALVEAADDRRAKPCCYVHLPLISGQDAAHNATPT